MKERLATMSVVSLGAGEWLLMHPNIELHKLPWPFAFAIWLVFGTAAGYVGDRIYNRFITRQSTFLSRFAALWAIIAVIVLTTFLFSRAVFWLV